MSLRLLPLLVLPACLWIGEDDLAARLDLDGDGVPRPEDCDDQDAAVGLPPTWYLDADDDSYGGSRVAIQCRPPEGYVDRAGDCDDQDRTVSPGATERCNGEDDDCDGDVDEDDAADASTWYTDADADGWGAGEARFACTAPSGTVALDGDCDDGDAAIHPDQPDACDGADTDCNGTVDDLQTWPDADGDGYGDPVKPIVWPDCTPPEGYVTEATDCDDGDPEVNPGAAEICDDLDRDEDCDGLRDDDDPDVAGTTEWRLDLDRDGYGRAVVASVSCDPPGLAYATTGGDCDDWNPNVNPGAKEIWYDGFDQDCDGADDFDADGDGHRVTSAGGDDCDDASAQSHPEAPEVCGDDRDNDCDGHDLGPCALAGDRSADDADLALLHVAATSGAAGRSAAALGDLDGDGNADLAIGAPGLCPESGPCGGGVWLLSGPFTGDRALEDVPALLLGEDPALPLGFQVWTNADVDGDGLPEVGAVASAYQEGEVHLFSGWPATPRWRAEAEVTLLMSSADGNLGWAHADLGDPGSDGCAEFALGAWSLDGEAGAVFLFGGPISGTASEDAAAVRLDGPSPGDRLGQALASADMDGDGILDLLAAAPQAACEGSHRGAVFLVMGPVDPSGRVDAVTDTTWCGEEDGDLAGSFLASPGDVDGDGRADILVGGGASSGSGLRGSVSLVAGHGLGPVGLGTAAIQFDGADAGDLAFHPIATGDLNGDLLGDFAVLATADVGGWGTNGTTYVFIAPPPGVLTPDDADAVIEAGPLGSIEGGAAAGDADGDGFEDFLLRMPQPLVTGTGEEVTGVFLFRGGP